MTVDSGGRIVAATAVELEPLLGREPTHWLQNLLQFGEATSSQWFLIGGAVRDLLLKRTGVGEGPKEFDLLTDGDLSLLLPLLKARWSEFFTPAPAPVETILFEKYRTAKLRFPELFLGHSELDISSSRAESYPTPGKPPTVRKGTLEEDLARRDFTINALALKLSSAVGGTAQVIDLFDGCKDLERRVLRVLHAKSFEDDPMRIVRAARFASRLSFTLGADTETLLHTAAANRSIEGVRRQRVGTELIKLLKEQHWPEALELLARWKVLDQILPGFEFADFQVHEDLKRATSWENCFVSLYRYNEEQVVEAARSLELSKKDIERLRDICGLLWNQ